MEVIQVYKTKGYLTSWKSTTTVDNSYVIQKNNPQLFAYFLFLSSFFSPCHFYKSICTTHQFSFNLLPGVPLYHYEKKSNAKSRLQMVRTYKNSLAKHVALRAFQLIRLDVHNDMRCVVRNAWSFHVPKMKWVMMLSVIFFCRFKPTAIFFYQTQLLYFYVLLNSSSNSIIFLIRQINKIFSGAICVV